MMKGISREILLELTVHFYMYNKFVNIVQKSFGFCEIIDKMHLFII